MYRLPLSDPEVLGDLLQPLSPFLLADGFVNVGKHILRHLLGVFDLRAVVPSFCIMNYLWGTQHLNTNGSTSSDLERTCLNNKGYRVIRCTARVI